MGVVGRADCVATLAGEPAWPLQLRTLVRRSSVAGMDVWMIILIPVVLLVVVVAVSSPFTARQKDAADAESRAHYDSDRQFTRPPNEGDLL